MMDILEIAARRLRQQQIASPTFRRPAEVVAWLGAVQAQDYLGALWAVGLRTHDATEGTIEDAIAAREIVRLWPMRGTIHFVAAADARWMVELMAPRVVQGSRSRLLGLGLDEAIIARSSAVIARALQGAGPVARPKMYALLEEAGISAADGRGLHILWRLAHDRLLCFGPREGKQPTFVLLEEWVPDAKSLPRDEALATLARRYFTGHGPATVQDLVWWSGLTATECRAAIRAIASELEQAVVEGQTYYFLPGEPASPEEVARVHLLATFEEYLLGYKDRTAVITKELHLRVDPGANGMFASVIVQGGYVIGTWKRMIQKKIVQITCSPFIDLTAPQREGIQKAAERYGAFLNMPVSVTFPGE